jgi:hypothetical protein
MVERLLDVFNRESQDLMFWFTMLIIVATMSYIVYNFWNRE